jgi:predicted ArsR family transcriptional regulator
MQVRSKPVDLDPLLNSIQAEPMTRAEIAKRSGLTYNQLRKQLPKLVQSGAIQWSSHRGEHGGEIRLYWLTPIATMLIVIPSMVALSVVPI